MLTVSQALKCQEACGELPWVWWIKRIKQRSYITFILHQHEMALHKGHIHFKSAYKAYFQVTLHVSYVTLKLHRIKVTSHLSSHFTDSISRLDHIRLQRVAAHLAPTPLSTSRPCEKWTPFQWSKPDVRTRNRIAFFGIKFHNASFHRIMLLRSN